MKYVNQLFTLALLTSGSAFCMQPLKVSELPIPQAKPVETQPQQTLAEKNNAVFAAINSGDVTKLKELLKENRTLANAENELGTALQQAALTGNLEIVKALIQAGANANAGQNYGMTPLMWAINGGNKDVIQYIINLPDVDVNAQDGSGQTALNWVGFSARLSDADRAEITKLLKAKGAQ